MSGLSVRRVFFLEGGTRVDQHTFSTDDGSNSIARRSSKEVKIMSKRSTRISRHVNAPVAKAYRALVEAGDF